ncbi:hypothetical protein MMC30_008098 [Trapelia coarctata]|nr:hypothetical protein [Trapelia coarctata]
MPTHVPTEAKAPQQSPPFQPQQLTIFYLLTRMFHPIDSDDTMTTKTLYRTKSLARTALAAQSTGRVVFHTQSIQFKEVEHEEFWYASGMHGESEFLWWTIQDVPLREGWYDDGDIWFGAEADEDPDGREVDCPSSDEEDDDDYEDEDGDDADDEEEDDEDEDEDEAEDEKEDGGVKISAPPPSSAGGSDDKHEKADGSVLLS